MTTVTWILAALAAAVLLAGLAVALVALARRPGADPLSDRAIAGSCWARYRDAVLEGAAWIARQPELVALNGLSAAPAFYYGDPPQVEWLEG